MYSLIMQISPVTLSSDEDVNCTCQPIVCSEPLQAGSKLADEERWCSQLQLCASWSLAETCFLPGIATGLYKNTKKNLRKKNRHLVQAPGDGDDSKLFCSLFGHLERNFRSIAPARKDGASAGIIWKVWFPFWRLGCVGCCFCRCIRLCGKNFGRLKHYKIWNRGSAWASDYKSPRDGATPPDEPRGHSSWCH